VESHAVKSPRPFGFVCAGQLETHWRPERKNGYAPTRIMKDNEPIPYRKVFVLWIPLAATWIMIALEGPFLAAVVARLAEPEFNLAAYGVAFSFAIIIEAPIIMMLSASTALVKDRESFLRLRNFTYFLNTVLTVFMVVLLTTPAFDFVAVRMIRLPEPVAVLTYKSLLVLLPWPGAIGYRRFYQGLFIRYDMSRRVAYGTVVRLATMSATALVLYNFSNLEGAVVGASALSVGVLAEAIASRLMVGGIVRRVRSVEPAKDEEPLTYGRIASFYIPLALTSTISLAVHPMITFFMGQSRLALESLVVFPVLNSLTFIFRSMGLSFQEVAIALLGEQSQNYPRLRNFAMTLGLASTFGLGLIAFTPLSFFWFHSVSGLSLELSDFARLPVQILTPLAFLSVLLSFQRSILVNGRTTKPITWTSIIEVAGIAVVLFVTIKLLGMVGVVAAAIAILLGRVAGNLYLVPPCLRVIRRSGTEMNEGVE
jgi:hypothetical protein